MSGIFTRQAVMSGKYTGHAVEEPSVPDLINVISVYFKDRANLNSALTKSHMDFFSVIIGFFIQIKNMG